MLQLYTSERYLVFPKVQPSACYEKLPYSYFRPTPLAWLLSACLHGGGGPQVAARAASECRRALIAKARDLSAYFLFKCLATIQ